MAFKEQPFKKKIYIKNYHELKEKLYNKAKYLKDDFKKGEKYVTKRVSQMMDVAEKYIRQEDIEGRIKKINWQKGVKAILLILIIVGAIASQNPVLFGTIVKAVTISTNSMANLAGLKSILPVFKTIFASLGSIEKVMIFVNILNIFIDDIPGAINIWKYDNSSITSFTRKALKAALDTKNVAYKNINYVENTGKEPKDNASKKENESGSSKNEPDNEVESNLFISKLVQKNLRLKRD